MSGRTSREDCATVLDLVAMITGIVDWDHSSDIDQDTDALMAVMGDLEAERLSAVLGAAGSIVVDLVNRLACATGQPRDDLWRECALDLTMRVQQMGEDRE